MWEGLLAGKSGMAEIKAFDLTGHPVRFAAEVKDFDPLVFIDKKESRKMGRFIHFAMAAAQEAMEHSGLEVDESNRDRFGVHIGSGIGGFDVIEREHSAMLAGGPRKISPFFIPAIDREPGGGACVASGTGRAGRTRRPRRLARHRRTPSATRSASSSAAMRMR